MTGIRATAICAALLSGVGGFAAAQQANPAPPMSLTSSAFTDGGVIPDKYTQAVPAPVSPPLAWENAPAGTVSYTLILRDPDVAIQKKSDDVLHWMVFNIPGATHSLPEGMDATAQLPNGSIQAKNITGKVGFLGSGARGNVYHHYTFELFALDTKLELGPDATRADVLKAMDGHIIGKAVDEGRFHR